MMSETKSNYKKLKLYSKKLETLTMKLKHHSNKFGYKPKIVKKVSINLNKFEIVGSYYKIRNFYQ